MKKRQAGSVRIIGGKWRGTRLPVPDIPGLRPSGDRGREILFNWLQADIRGSRCADLFAGSGVLGLEAASRGAARVDLVEKSGVAAEMIGESVARLAADVVNVTHADAITWLQQCKAETLDIVFVDPPFGKDLEVRSLQLLLDRDCLRAGGLVYLETARQEPAGATGPRWELVKEKALGDVKMQLLKKTESF